MIRLFALIMAALLLQGCRVDKKDPRQVHQAPPPVVQDDPTTPEDKKAGYYGVDLNAIFEKSKSAKAESRVKSVIAPLANLFLNQENLSNNEFKGHSQTTWALNFMNTQIMEALKENGKDPDLKNILATYRNRILQSCHPRDLSGCQNLKFFRRDPQVVGIIKVLALQTQEIEAYYRLLATAFELKSDVADPELKQMVYGRMVEFLKVYVDVTKNGEAVHLSQKRMTDAQRKEFVFYSTFISTVLKTSDDIQLTGAQSVELFQWVGSNDMDIVIGRDLSLVIGNLVSGQLGQPEIWAAFVSLFNREQAGEDVSYTNALKRVQQHDPALLGRLGVKPYDLGAQVQSRSKNLAAVFFLSRIYDLRPPSRERYLWDLAKMDPMEALDLIEAFVRVTMVDRMIDTHKKMAGFFNKYQHDGKAKQELLFETMKYSDQNLTPRWKDYVTRVQQLETFFADEFERTHSNEKGTPLAERILKLRNFFEELNPSIKYMVTYPNMIMLGYYAAKMNLDFNVETFFGSKIEINKDLVLHDLMEGKIGPMFLYTSFKSAETKRNSEGIDSVQMFWSLYYAMVTDLPKLYNIPADEFLGTFLGAYKERNDERMRKTIAFHRDLLQPSAEVQQLLRICDQPEGAVNFFSNRIDIQEVKNATFLGALGSGTRPPLRSAVSLTNLSASVLNNSFDEALELLRSDVDPKLRRLYLIRSAFKLARSTDTAGLKRIDGLLTESLDMRKRIIDSSRLFIEKLPMCVIRMRAIEVQRRREVFAMEVQFLRAIQKALQTLSSTKDEQAAVIALSKGDPFFADIDTSKPMLAALNEVVTRKTNLDAAFNVIADYRGDYARSGGFQRDSTGKLYFNHRSRDMIIRIGQFMTYGFMGAKISNHLDRLTVLLPPTLKELEMRSSGSSPTGNDMQLFSRPGDGVVSTALDHFRGHMSWFGDAHAATSMFRSFLRQMTALYKFDYLGDLDLENQIVCDAACKQAKYDWARAGATKLIELSRTMLDELNFNEQDVAILKLFEVPSFYRFEKDGGTYGMGPKYLFMETDGSGTEAITGMTDEAFTYLTSLTLGFHPIFRGMRQYAEAEWMVKQNDTGNMFSDQHVIKSDELITRTNYFEAAQKYYITLRDKQNLLLYAMDPEIERQIDLFHTLLIRSDFDIADIFLEVAPQWAASNPMPFVQFSTLMDGLHPPLLSSTLIGNYRAQIEKFHEDTNHIFDKSRK